MATRLWKLAPYLLLIVTLLGFYYVETSFLLKVLATILGLIGLITLKSTPEIFVLLLLYLGFDDLYNFRYGLAIPLSVIIGMVFIFTTLAFELWSRAEFKLEDKDQTTKNIIALYSVIAGFLSLEIFLTMSFWPVEAKTKSLTSVIIFYLLLRIFCLARQNVLNLRKALVLISVSLLLLTGVLFLNIYLGY